MPKGSYTPHARTRDAWKKFIAWYGADHVERRYGLQAPSEWDRVLSRLDRDKMAAVLSDTKSEHSSYMPSLGDFEQIVERHLPTVKPVVGPSIIERFCEYGLKRCSPEQAMVPWTYHFLGSSGGPGVPASPDHAVIAVTIPAREKAPQIRISLEELLDWEAQKKLRREATKNRGHQLQKGLDDWLKD